MSKSNDDKYILNPESGRYVLKTGPIGKKLMSSSLNSSSSFDMNSIKNSLEEIERPNKKVKFDVAPLKSDSFNMNNLKESIEDVIQKNVIEKKEDLVEKKVEKKEKKVKEVKEEKVKEVKEEKVKEVKEEKVKEVKEEKEVKEKEISGSILGIRYTNMNEYNKIQERCRRGGDLYELYKKVQKSFVDASSLTPSYFTNKIMYEQEYEN